MKRKINHKVASKIFVITILDTGIVNVETVTKLYFSSFKEYAVKWTYTTNESEIENLKKKIKKAL